MGRYTLASNRDTHYKLEHVNKKKSVNKTRFTPCNHTSAKKRQFTLILTLFILYLIFCMIFLAALYRTVHSVRTG